MQKELKQIHTREVLNSKYANELSEEQKLAALKYLMFLKEKSKEQLKVEAVQMDVHKKELLISLINKQLQLVMNR